MLEDDPTFNAGRGSHLNSAGELSRWTRRSWKGRSGGPGAVAAISRRRAIRSPSRDEWSWKNRRTCSSSAPGAKRFAKRVGRGDCARPLAARRTRAVAVGAHPRGRSRASSRRSSRRRARPHGTVGAVALDLKGRVGGRHVDRRHAGQGARPRRRQRDRRSGHLRGRPTRRARHAPAGASRSCARCWRRRPSTLLAGGRLPDAASRCGAPGARPPFRRRRRHPRRSEGRARRVVQHAAHGAWARGRAGLARARRAPGASRL